VLKKFPTLYVATQFIYVFRTLIKVEESRSKSFWRSCMNFEMEGRREKKRREKRRGKGKGRERRKRMSNLNSDLIFSMNKTL
jgi:hypothetical protein